MELIYTWSELKAVQDRISEIGRETDAITARRRQGASWDEEKERYNALWDERFGLEGRRDIMRKQVIPEVGMPCTVKWYSDSSGAHIEKILSPKCIQVKCDGIYSCTKIFTLRKNGRWIEKGTTTRDWGTLCFLGYRHDYYDRTF